MTQIVHVGRLMNPPAVYSAGGGPPAFAWDFRHRFEGADGATTLSPDEIGGKTVTVAGDAKLSASQSIDGATSLLLDGSGDAAVIADNNLWAFSTNQFAIAAKVRPASLSATHTIMGQWRSSNPFRAWTLRVSATGVVSFLASSTGISTALTLASAAGALAAGVGAEILVDRDAANDIRLYINGSMVAKTNSAVDIFNAAVAMRFGAELDATGAATFFLNGVLDDVRIRNGAAFVGSDAGYSVTTVLAGQWDFSNADQSSELLTVGIM